MRLALPALFLCATLVGGALPAVAQKTKPIASFEGRVVKVLDGATLVVRLADKTEQTVRLQHIDPPETCQPGGEESKKSLVDVALGKNVQVSGASRMPSGTLQAAVTLDEVNLSRRQVEEGQAWSQRFRYDNGPLVKEERMAKALKRGFHGAGNAVMPKDFRQRYGPCS